MSKLKYLLKEFILFLIGGSIYYLLEILWRGYSHWTMFILGGICFVIIGLLNEQYDYNMPLVEQMFSSMIIITTLEFISGVILNIILKLNIWDYSNLPFNLFGQICIPFMIIWFFLSPIAIVVDDYIRYFIFKEEKPHYKIF